MKNTLVSHRWTVRDGFNHYIDVIDNKLAHSDSPVCFSRRDAESIASRIIACGVAATIEDYYATHEA